MAQYTGKNAALQVVYFDTEGDGTVGDPYRMKQGSAPTTDARLGATDETAAATDTATAGLNGLVKRLLARITTLLGVLPGALGAGGGVKVDGSGTALPVSGTVTANLGTIGGAATEATLGTLNGKVTACDTGAVVVSSSVLPTGAASLTEQQTQTAAIGATNETAAATDTATAGLNGLLKRLLARITTLLGVLPGALGAGGGIKVDGSGTALPVSGTVSVTGTFWQATQPVSLASSVSVTNAGTFAVQASQSGGWTVELGATDNAVLDDLAAKLATIDADTSALAGAVAGSEVQVDVLTLPALPAGTNNIGDVDVVTQPARARTTDTISAALATDAMMVGATALTPKFANVDTATSGANTIVAAVTSKKIRVLGMQLIAAKGATAVGAKLRDDAGSPASLYGGTGRVALDTTGATGPGGFTLPFSPVGWFETTAGQALILDLDAAQRVIGTVCYVEI